MTWQNIPGRCAYLWLYDDFLASNPAKDAVVVEVGVALGKSVAYLAEKCIEMGRHDIQIFAVDPWEGTARNGEQQELADKEGGDFTLYCNQMMAHCPAAFEMIRPLRSDGADAAPYFPDGEVALVALDGDHTFTAVSREIAAWWPKLTHGGAIGGDDHHAGEFPGVIQACEWAFGPATSERGVRATRGRFANSGYEICPRHNGFEWPTWRKVKP